MILLDDSESYKRWVEEKLEREEILANKIKLLEAEIRYLKGEVAYLQGYRDAMRGQ